MLKIGESTFFGWRNQEIVSGLVKLHVIVVSLCPTIYPFMGRNQKKGRRRFLDNILKNGMQKSVSLYRV